jgi:hypothetical protein
MSSFFKTFPLALVMYLFLELETFKICVGNLDQGLDVSKGDSRTGEKQHILQDPKHTVVAIITRNFTGKA